MKKNFWIVILFFIGLVILIYPHGAQLVNEQIQKSHVKQFKETVELMPPEEINHHVNSVKECNEAIYNNEDGLHDPFTEAYDRSRIEECKDTPDDGTNIASIEIPKLDLEIPIYLGSTENELSKGVGHVEGSSLPIGGNSTHTVLAGHRGMGTKVMFRHLDELKRGDTFFIYTLEDKLEYRVYDVEIVLPHETDSLQITDTEDRASLITCHPYGSNSHRLLVHAERVSEK
ncbi:class C sortase [Lentibacillus saliphilus]|uniref:class C sortase n=1 Tax=Lentibacillus saliphilus TaxID=2737028 RepID=UPI001C303111|nr:class C sortase [Lentibacillus saliphilus]